MMKKKVVLTCQCIQNMASPDDEIGCTRLLQDFQVDLEDPLTKMPVYQSIMQPMNDHVENTKNIKQK